jgi:FkbM family methyltransferase
MSIKQFGNRVFSHLPGHLGRKHKKRYYRHLTEGVGHQFAAVLDQLKDTSLVLDLGANVGEYTSILAERAGQVIAFEPDPYAFGLLTQNTKHLTNVRIIQAAASTEDGSVTLYRRHGYEQDPMTHSQGSSLFSAKANIDEHNGFQVEAIDIVAFMEQLDQDIQLIKIDIEGAEVPVLERLLDAPVANRVGDVFAETHEFKIPALYRRTEKLRQRARKLEKPRLHLNWR